MCGGIGNTAVSEEMILEEEAVSEEQINQDVETEPTKWRKKKLIARSVVVIIYISFALSILIGNFLKKNDYIKKEELQDVILRVVNKNEKKLEILKSIIENPNNYVTREKEKFSINFLSIDSLMSNFNYYENYYEKPISLKSILIELRDKEYIKINGSEETIKKLEDYITELNKISLIDKLLPNQKDNFYNIKGKLDEQNYNLIKIDLDKIIEEIDLKNKLTDKYLANSDQSYRLSVISLFIAVISFIPILLWIFTSLKKFFLFLKQKFKFGGQND